MLLDIRTLLAAFTVANLVMALAFWLTFAGQMRDGLGRWTLSLLVQTVAWVLFAIRGIGPEAISIVGANALLVLAVSMQAAALLEFQRREPPVMLVVAPFALAVVTLTLLIDDPAMRLAAGSLLHATMAGAIIALVLRFQVGVSLRARWLMIGSYSVWAAIFLLRLARALLDPGGMIDLFATHTLHSTLFLSGLALIVLNSFGFLLMHKERADARNAELAATDPLTGAYNRRTFIDLAARELALAQRNGNPLSLLMLDLDHFKSVNDRHGHLAGDAVLRQFATRIAGCLRKGDMLVRYGGEEFCVLLPGTGAEGARVLAERVRELVEMMPMNHESTMIPLTVSVGIATLPPDALSDIEKLLSAADEALYRAKTSGRNRVVSAQPALLAAA